MGRWIIIVTMWIMMREALSQTTQLEWAPVGAKWYYEVVQGYPFEMSYLVYKSEKDTTVGGIMCRKIIIDTTETKSMGSFFANYNFFNSIAYSGYTDNFTYKDKKVSFTYERNDTVYYYHFSCSKFVPVAYNLSDTTDRWYVMKTHNTSSDPLCPAMATITPHKIDTINWMGKKLKRFECTSKFINSISQTITLCGSYIKGIGWVGEWNYNKCNYPGQVINSTCGFLPVWYPNYVDGIYLGPLRCYYHPVFGWFNYGNKPCDSTTFLPKLTIESELIHIYYVYPYLYVKSKKELFPVEVEICNLLGQKIYSGISNEEVIHIPIYNNMHSILFVKVRDGKGRLIVKKINV